MLGNSRQRHARRVRGQGRRGRHVPQQHGRRRPALARLRDAASTGRAANPRQRERRASATTSGPIRPARWARRAAAAPTSSRTAARRRPRASFSTTTSTGTAARRSRPATSSARSSTTRIASWRIRCFPRPGGDRPARAGTGRRSSAAARRSAQEFERLVSLYGAIGGGSPAVGRRGPRVHARRRHPRPRRATRRPTSAPSRRGLGRAGDRADVRAFGRRHGRRDHGRRLSERRLRRDRRRGGDRRLRLERVVPDGLHPRARSRNAQRRRRHQPGHERVDADEGWFSDFLDVPQPDPFHPYVETLFRAGITSGCHGGNFCRDARAAPQADGRAAAALEARRRPRAAAGDRNGLRRRARERSLRRLDRGARGSRDHGRLRQRQLLSGQPRHAPPDGGVPAQDEVRQHLRPAGGGRGSSGTCRRGTGSRPGSSELYGEGVTGGCQAAPLLYCPHNPNTRGQMAVFLVKAFGL